MDKQIKTFNITSLDLDIIFDRKTIQGAIDSLQSKLQEMSKTYPQYNDFKFSVDYVQDGYDSGYKVMIQGSRLETDEEYETRTRSAQQIEEQLRTKELNELARLKEKYENKFIL
jgi:hypothetical protein